MSVVINVLLPIFGLILIGYLCRRGDILGPNAAAELNRFVVWLCLPALLFNSTATASWQQIWHPGFVISYGVSTMAVFALTLAVRWRGERGFADASIDGLSAAYANTGYIGIPLCLLVLGQNGLEPALIATLVVVFVLFSIAVVCVEIGLQVGTTFSQAVKKVLIALAKNPLVMSPIAGSLWAMSGWPLPAPAHQFLNTLGTATTPCALVSLGLFLAHKHEGTREGTATLVALKLVLHPLITWMLAFKVFALPPLWANSALLLSALPTGTGPYMLADFYRREASLVSSTVLYSTIASVATLSLCLWWIGCKR
jgi:malonate transporter